MAKKKVVAEQLKNLQAMRLQVEAMNRAMQVLTPEERLLVEQLLINPATGNTEMLCQLLGVEKSSIYRRKDRALDKLTKSLGN